MILLLAVMVAILKLVLNYFLKLFFHSIACFKTFDFEVIITNIIITKSIVIIQFIIL